MCVLIVIVQTLKTKPTLNNKMLPELSKDDILLSVTPSLAIIAGSPASQKTDKNMGREKEDRTGQLRCIREFNKEAPARRK